MIVSTWIWQSRGSKGNFRKEASLGMVSSRLHKCRYIVLPSMCTFLFILPLWNWRWGRRRCLLTIFMSVTEQLRPLFAPWIRTQPLPKSNPLLHPTTPLQLYLPLFQLGKGWEFQGRSGVQHGSASTIMSLLQLVALQDTFGELRFVIEPWGPAEFPGFPTSLLCVWITVRKESSGVLGVQWAKHTKIILRFSFVPWPTDMNLLIFHSCGLREFTGVLSHPHAQHASSAYLGEFLEITWAPELMRCISTIVITSRPTAILLLLQVVIKLGSHSWHLILTSWVTSWMLAGQK